MYIVVIHYVEIVDIILEFSKNGLEIGEGFSIQ